MNDQDLVGRSSTNNWIYLHIIWLGQGSEVLVKAQMAPMSSRYLVWSGSQRFCDSMNDLDFIGRYSSNELDLFVLLSLVKGLKFWI